MSILEIRTFDSKPTICSLPENYRPVSLTCICCKVMEHVINISSNTQKSTAYVQCCSMVSDVRDYVNHNYWSPSTIWNKNTQLDVIVLDFSKAFDTVPHDRLLGKLDHHGINGHIHSWISNFLKHRSQCVLVEGAKSDPAHVVSGV